MWLNVVKGRFITRGIRHLKICSAGSRTMYWGGRHTLVFVYFLSLDNYNPHQGSKESVNQQDKYEEDAFIEEISRSAPIKYLHRYLVLKGSHLRNMRISRECWLPCGLIYVEEVAALAALLRLSMCLWERSRVRGKVTMRFQASTTWFKVLVMFQQHSYTLILKEIIDGIGWLMCSFTFKNPMAMLDTKGTYFQEGMGSWWVLSTIRIYLTIGIRLYLISHKVAKRFKLACSQTLRLSCSPFSLSGVDGWSLYPAHWLVSAPSLKLHLHSLHLCWRRR
jgi:hypothetical protein